MEILSYLRQEGLRGEILHGSPAYIRSRIEALSKVEEARRFLEYKTLGIVGHPSDWLISSGFDRDVILDKLGISLQYIPMEELLEEYSSLKDDVAESWNEVRLRSCRSLSGAEGPLLHPRQARPFPERTASIMHCRPLSPITAFPA